MGKLGPTLIFDHTTDRRRWPAFDRDRRRDRRQERDAGSPQEMQAALTKANLPLATPAARRQWQGRRRQDPRHDCA